MVVTARAYFKHAARHAGRAPSHEFVTDECVLHDCSRAKYAAAFFRMSFSSVNLRTSASSSRTRAYASTIVFGGALTIVFRSARRLSRTQLFNVW